MTDSIRGVIYDTWPTLVALLLIFIIMRVTLYFKGEGKLVLYQEIFNMFFMVYLILLFQLVTSQDITAVHTTNFIPFKEILRYDLGSAAFFKQVIGNIIMFLPFGYFATSYCNIKNLGTITLVSFLSSLVIEGVQYFIGRSFDVDDIILNVVGGVIGFLLYISFNAIWNHMPKFLRKDWLLNLLCILIVALIGFYVFGIMF